MAKKKAKRFGWGWVNGRGQFVKKDLDTCTWGDGDYSLVVIGKRDAEYFCDPGERVVRVEIREV